MTSAARDAHIPTRNLNPHAVRSSETYSRARNRGIRPTFNERRTNDERRKVQTRGTEEGIIIQTSNQIRSALIKK